MSIDCPACGTHNSLEQVKEYYKCSYCRAEFWFKERKRRKVNE